jgi:hypothetical protein
MARRAGKPAFQLKVDPRGEWKEPQEVVEHRDGRHEYTQWQGYTLQSVEFADVTGNGQEEAVVVLRYRTGGTQQTDYVYIYSFAAGKPELLAYFHTGDRAASGFYRVYGEDRKLVVELLDPEKQLGDCCSSGFVRTRYEWRNGRFETFGARESLPLQGQ